MQKIVFAIALLLAALATPASSATKWMASNGTGSVCSRTEPCNSPNFASANDEMHCVDSLQSANFSAPFAFSIICDRADLAMQFASYLAATNGVVVIDGVNFNCATFTPRSGIEFRGAGTLIVRNVRINNCVNGISFTPNGAAKLVIDNVTVANNSGSGVLIQPSGAGSVQVGIDGLRAVGNVGGIFIAAPAGFLIEAKIRNSILDENSNFGVVNAGAGGASVVFIEHSSMSNNANIGVFSQGANAFTFVGQSVLARNNTGWAFAAGGVLATYGDNTVNSATAAGGPSARVTRQ